MEISQGKGVRRLPFLLPLPRFCKGFLSKDVQRSYQKCDAFRRRAAFSRKPTS